MTDPRWQTVGEALHEAWAVDAQEAFSALAALEYEMERLREALREIADAETDNDYEALALQTIARAALGGEE